MKNLFIAAIAALALSACFLDAMEYSEEHCNHARAIRYALAAALDKEKDADAYRQLSIVKNLLFPDSYEPAYLIFVHARALHLGPIEIQCSGATFSISGFEQIYASLLNCMDVNPGTPEAISLENDLRAAVSLLHQ